MAREDRGKRGAIEVVHHDPRGDQRQLIVVGTNGQPIEHYRLIYAHCQHRQPADTSTGITSFGAASTP